MRSRLLPNAEQEDREAPDVAPRPKRRESDMVKTFEDVESAVAVELTSTPSRETPGPTPRPAPQVSARPQGRLVVFAILLACVGSVGYSLWSTFLRDAAYGVVTGKVTKLSPPWPGTLTAVYVRPGDSIRQGEVLAVLEDAELQDQIDRRSDELRSAQAQLDAQVSLLAVTARQRHNAAAQLQADYFELRGELLSEHSRLAELDRKLLRREELADKRAYSEEEIESLKFRHQGLVEKIENLNLSVNALEVHLEQVSSDDQATAQLKPWLAKIENTQAEIERLREKQRRGTLRAPFQGTVVGVTGHVGERVASDLPILEVLPSDSLELVLYITQANIEDYRVSQRLAVIVEPDPKSIVCEVTRFGSRLEKPQAHVSGRYRPEQKLVPLYLKPVEKIAATKLRLGSTIRLPATLFNSVE